MVEALFIVLLFLGMAATLAATLYVALCVLSLCYRAWNRLRNAK